MTQKMKRARMISCWYCGQAVAVRIKEIASTERERTVLIGLMKDLPFKWAANMLQAEDQKTFTFAFLFSIFCFQHFFILWLILRHDEAAACNPFSA